MRTSTRTSVTVVALGAIAVLGAQYASAATTPSPAAAADRSVASVGSTTVSTAALQQLAVARPNISYVYSAQDFAGVGQVQYTIPNPPSGLYHASFTANFYPAGSPDAPATFSCYLVKNDAMRAQSTASTTSSGGFFAGVNGANSVKVAAGDDFYVGCGTADGSSWDYGTRALQVSFTRIDGIVNVALPSAAQKAGRQGAVAR